VSRSLGVRYVAQPRTERPRLPHRGLHVAWRRTRARLGPASIVVLIKQEFVLISISIGLHVAWRRTGARLGPASIVVLINKSLFSFRSSSAFTLLVAALGLASGLRLPGAESSTESMPGHRGLQAAGRESCPPLSSVPLVPRPAGLGRPRWSGPGQGLGLRRAAAGHGRPAPAQHDSRDAQLETESMPGPGRA
jgi:hypothetical protein